MGLIIFCLLLQTVFELWFWKVVFELLVFVLLWCLKQLCQLLVLLLLVILVIIISNYLLQLMYSRPCSRCLCLLTQCTYTCIIESLTRMLLIGLLWCWLLWNSMVIVSPPLCLPVKSAFCPASCFEPGATLLPWLNWYFSEMDLKVAGNNSARCYALWQEEEESFPWFPMWKICCQRNLWTPRPLTKMDVTRERQWGWKALASGVKFKGEPKSCAVKRNAMLMQYFKRLKLNSRWTKY